RWLARSVRAASASREDPVSENNATSDPENTADRKSRTSRVIRLPTTNPVVKGTSACCKRKTCRSNEAESGSNLVEDEPSVCYTDIPKWTQPENPGCVAMTIAPSR